MTVKRRMLAYLGALLLISTCLTSCNQPAEINVACDVDDLIDAIHSANANSDTTKLILHPNCTYAFQHKDNDDGDQGPNALPTVTTKIHVVGNNTTLLRTTSYYYRFFFITGSGSLHLEDVILDNGSAFVISADQPDSRGGAVYNDGGALRAQRSLFLDNRAIDGGAIYNLGVLTVEDTNFEVNFSRNGGAIYNGGNLDIVAVLQNVNFETNTAYEKGGALYNSSADTGFLISGSTFDLNHSYGHGGAIYMESGDLGVSSSTFLENQAGRSDDPFGDGGAIYSLAGDVTIHGCEFNSQKAYGGGGAVYAGPGAELTLLDSWVEGNSTCHGGGALRVEGEAEVLETTFKDNSSGGTDGLWSIIDPSYSQECEDPQGAAIHNSGTLALDRSLFDGNYSPAGMGEGAGVYNTGDLTIVNTSFDNNWPQLEAVNNHGNAELSLSTFVNSDLLNSGTMTVKNIVVQSRPDSCINSGTFGVIGQNIADDPACPFSDIILDADISYVLWDNGGPTLTHHVEMDSPVIDMATCSTVAGDPVTVDQRGFARPYPAGGACDIGASEVEYWIPPVEPSPSPPMPDSGLVTTLRCNLFEGLEFSMVLMSIPQETNDLTLYITMPGGVPGLELEIPDDTDPFIYSALLGNTESEECSFYADASGRLYCDFTLPATALGSAQDFLLHLNGCEDPIFSLPWVSIPERQQPSPTCNKDLDEASCEAAGGFYVGPPVRDQWECFCP